jgi:hypothetical protein
MVGSLYLVHGRLRCLVSNTCKRSLLIKIRILWYLNKYFFKKKYNNILEKSSENIYVVENKNYKSLFWMSYAISLVFYGESDWCIISSLWYFKLYCKL